MEHGERRLAGVHGVTTGGDETRDGRALVVARSRVRGLVLGLDLGAVVAVELGSGHGELRSERRSEKNGKKEDGI